MMNQIRKAMSSEKGFTLVELLVVIGIIGILAMMLLPQFRGMRDRARIASCESNLKNVGTQLESFYADRERYPNSTEWTAMVGATGALAKIAYCPHDKVVYTYMPGAYIDTSVAKTALGTYDAATAFLYTGGVAPAAGYTGRIDSFITYCTFHEGSTAAGATEPELTQLLVTGDGVQRMP